MHTLRGARRFSVRDLPAGTITMLFTDIEGSVGLDVHYAARIMSAAYGGQVLLSRTTRELVEHDLPEGVSLRDLGEHYLKDLERPIHLYQLVIAGLPADFSPLKTLGNRSD